MKKLPDVAKAIACSNKNIIVFFSDGKVTQFDVSPLIQKESSFMQLENEDVFSKYLTVINGIVAWDLCDDHNLDHCLILNSKALYNSRQLRSSCEEESKLKEHEINLLLEQRREIETVLNNHENYMIRSAEAIIGAHIVMLIFTSNEALKTFLSDPLILFLLIQFYLVAAGWTVAVLAGRDEDREYMAGIDYVLRKNYNIRTSFHDGGIFLHRSGGASLFKAVAAFLAVMMFSTLLIIMIAKGKLFLKHDYWWLLPIVGAEFVVIVIFAYKKTRKTYKRKLDIVNMVYQDCSADAETYADRYKDVFQIR